MAGVNLGTAYISIIPDMSKVASEVNKGLSRMDAGGERAGKSVGSRMSNAMGTALKRGALVAGAGAAALVGGALVKGFQRLKGIDDARAKLEGLGHSAKTVDGVMDNALAAVKGTSFGLNEAATAAASAVAAGIKPGEQLERTLTLMGDAATIAGTDFNDMAAIFNKVAAGGMLQGEEIAQLGDRGIPILQLLGKELGVSAQEVRQLASRGAIDFATFQNAMEAGLGGAAQKSGQTFTGALANAQAALGRLGASLLSGVFPLVTKALNSSIGALDTLAPIAERVGKAIGSALSRGARAAADAIGWLRDALAPAVPLFQRLFEFLRKNPEIIKGAAAGLGVLAAAIGVVTAATAAWAVALNATGIPLLIIGVAALGAAIFYAYKRSEAFRVAVQQAGAALQALGQWLARDVLPAVVALAKHIAAKAGPSIKALGEVIASDVLPTIAALSARLKAWMPTVLMVAGVVLKLWLAFVKLYITVASKVVPVLIRVVGFFVRLAPIIISIINPIVRVVVVFATLARAIARTVGAIARLAGAVIRGVAVIVGAALAMQARVLAAFRATWGGARAIAAGALAAIRAVVIRGFSAVRGAVVAAMGAVRNVIGRSWVSAQAVVRRGVEGIVRAVAAVPDRIVQLGAKFLAAGKSVVGKIFDGIKEAASGAGQLAGNIAQAIKDAINRGLGLPLKLGKGPLSFTIPAFARGGVSPGGWALVGEEGPELVNLNRGARVYSHGDSVGMARQLSGGGTDLRGARIITTMPDGTAFTQMIREVVRSELSYAGAS